MIDREAEYDWLSLHLRDEDRQVLVLFGRRRIGKTTLLTHALEHLGLLSVYYQL